MKIEELKLDIGNGYIVHYYDYITITFKIEKDGVFTYRYFDNNDEATYDEIVLTAKKIVEELEQEIVK